MTASLTPIREAIRTFLIDELGGADLHLVAIVPDGPARGRYFGSDVDAATTWATEQNTAGRNLYWTVNRAAAGVDKKPTKADIVHVRFAQIDIDPPKGGGPFDRDAVATALNKGPVPPSLIIDSGGGVQAFWRIGADGAGQDEIEAVNVAIRDRFGGDNCQNVDRVMRLPGTVNWPNKKKEATGRVPRMATLIAPDMGMPYDVADLAAAFQAGGPLSCQKSSTDIDAEDAQSLAALGIRPGDGLHELLINPPGLDRSKDTYLAALELLRHGFGEQTIAGILGTATASACCRTMPPDLPRLGRLANAAPQRASPNHSSPPAIGMILAKRPPGLLRASYSVKWPCPLPMCHRPFKSSLVSLLRTHGGHWRSHPPPTCQPSYRVSVK